MFGTAYFASNIDEYYMVLNNPNLSIGIIDDNAEKYKVRTQNGQSVMPRTGIVMLSSLLPPPEAITAYIDGRTVDASRIYSNYLNTDNTAQNIISVLLKLFFVGRNIVLFIPRDEATSIQFASVLSSYLYRIFGVQIGNIRNMRSAITNPNRIQYSNMLDMLYLYDNISFPVYCKNHPIDIIASNGVINKIIAIDSNMLNHNVSRFNNFNDAVQYAMDIIKCMQCDTVVNTCMVNNTPEKKKLRSVIRFKKDDKE
jgi:hypothetical protein